MEITTLIDHIHLFEQKCFQFPITWVVQVCRKQQHNLGMWNPHLGILCCTRSALKIELRVEKPPRPSEELLILRITICLGTLEIVINWKKVKIYQVKG